MGPEAPESTLISLCRRLNVYGGWPALCLYGCRGCAQCDTRAKAIAIIPLFHSAEGIQHNPLSRYFCCADLQHAMQGTALHRMTLLHNTCLVDTTALQMLKQNFSVVLVNTEVCGFAGRLNSPRFSDIPFVTLDSTQLKVTFEWLL